MSINPPAAFCTLALFKNAKLFVNNKFDFNVEMNPARPQLVITFKLLKHLLFGILDLGFWDLGFLILGFWDFVILGFWILGF